MKRITTSTYQFLVKSRTGIRLLDILRGIAEFTKRLPDNIAFRYANPTYPVPPLGLMFDAYAHMSYREYRTSGQETASFYAHLFQRHRKFLEEKETRILEWGCGAARILRHLKDSIPQKNIRISGTDYNPQTITWCHETIAGIEFRHNELNPPLPFDDDSFEIVYCLSVFTHLSLDKTKEWLAELCRVTTPGGLISFSTQGDADIGKLSDNEANLYRQGEPVVRSSEIEGKKYFSVFHPPQYVRGELLKNHEILDALLINNSEIGQDVWLIKNEAFTATPP